MDPDWVDVFPIENGDIPASRVMDGGLDDTDTVVEQAESFLL